MLGKVTRDALLFWATIDPIGTVALFAALTALVLPGVLAVTLLMMLVAGKILRVLASHRSEVLVRVLGMLLAALSVELVMQALGAERWARPGP